MQNIQSNLIDLNRRIDRACALAGRPRDSITLVGVTKTRPVADVRSAAALGIRDLGENYLDEAIEKIRLTPDLDLTWHFIGRVQSNKTKTIAEYFQWVHTLDREKIARRLNRQCPPGKQLQVLVQINIDNDPAKGGVSAERAFDLVRMIATLPRLRLRGLMAIPARNTDPGASYKSMAQLFTSLGEHSSLADQTHWDTLSMGMTGDLEQAIAHGATHIRIGTALFGARD